jgi:hypothetical protein
MPSRLFELKANSDQFKDRGMFAELASVFGKIF